MTKKERFYVSSAQAIVVMFREDVPTGEELLCKYHESLQRLILSNNGIDIDDAVEVIYNGNVIIFQYLNGETLKVGERDFRGYLLEGFNARGKDPILYRPDQSMIDEMNKWNKNGFEDPAFDLGDKFGIGDSVIVDDVDNSVDYLILTYVNDVEPILLKVIHDEEGNVVLGDPDESEGEKLDSEPSEEE